MGVIPGRRDSGEPGIHDYGRCSWVPALPRLEAGVGRNDRGVCDVIPVTSCAGRKLAVFGLGSSGLSTCEALAAGGAQPIAFDDDPAKVAAAAGRGIATADLRKIDWAKVAALVLSPGVPLTHPAP